MEKRGDDTTKSHLSTSIPHDDDTDAWAQYNIEIMIVIITRGYQSMLRLRLDSLLLTLLIIELLFCVLPKVSEATTTTFPSDPHYDNAYSRRSHYPEYCSTPEHMHQRHIPPLGTTFKEIGETRLVHVTTVIRHGARTPWSSELHCWDGFWESPETGVWDCNLTTFMTQPIVDGKSSSSSSNEKDEAMFLFDKRYDALLFPNDHLTNELNGTCQMGQLLSRGHEQQLYNGKIMREAYVYTKGEYDHDERMRLLDVSLEDYVPWNVEYLHFRADDDQRTVMSGQVLLRGMFDTEFTQHYEKTKQYPSIPLHIADRDRDIVDANKHDCPRLADIYAQAIQSPEFQAFDNSPQSQKVRQYMSEQANMGPDTRNSILDCLMTTMCTDRTLPDAIDDFDGTNENWFHQLAEYDIETYTKLMKYNQSEFAKLALGPLWFEILQNINPYLEADTSNGDAENLAAPKLALIAGHDTTIMPLLASLGPTLWNDTAWPPYASMMNIELHELIDGQSDTSVYGSNFAFRLLYNGKILTSLIEGCQQDLELCDIVHFKALVDPIATRNTDCASSSTAKVSILLSPSFLSLSTTTGAAIFVTLVLLSGVVGSSLTYVVMKSRFLRYAGRTKIEPNGAVWTIDGNDDDDYGLEMREGGFHDEPVDSSVGKESSFVNGNGH
ncbi:MAG: hypothetical protein SGILL_005127 [Bacillariaceae sp.]